MNTATRNKNFISTPVAVVCLMALASAVSAQGITHFEEIAEDLYFVGNVSHNTVFLVTDEGIILADPTNRDFSLELRAEIEGELSPGDIVVVRGGERLNDGQPVSIIER